MQAERQAAHASMLAAEEYESDGLDGLEALAVTGLKDPVGWVADMSVADIAQPKDLLAHDEAGEEGSKSR
jgi:hypothetical protein